MASIQWRPEVNALTIPQSYKIRYVPRAVIGYDELAAQIAAANPNWNEALVKAVLAAMIDAIQQNLLAGNQVTLENAFSFRLSFTGKLDQPDDPLPNSDDLLQVKISASVPFVQGVRTAAQLERLPAAEKLPVIVAAEDTRLKLNDVLNPKGVLKLTGTNLFFDQEDEGCGCVIEGTQSGRAAQSQYGMISNAAVLLVPDIPAQAHPWNNEYTLSLSTQYTEHGTLRTGVCPRRLRSPLTMTGLGHPNPQEIGMLTDKAASPYVSVTGGTVAADETLRVQAVWDIRDGHLLFSLLDMKENSLAGAAVTVTANGEYTLPGFAGSAVSSLKIRVNEYAALVKMIRNGYAGRVADILAVKMA